jgi:hypothetical protein
MVLTIKKILIDNLFNKLNIYKIIKMITEEEDMEYFREQAQFHKEYRDETILLSNEINLPITDKIDSKEVLC